MADGHTTLVADHGSIAVNHAGQVHFQAAARSRAAWPHQVGRIPRPAQSFQRRDLVDQLLTAVEEDGSAVPGHVLTGTGGVGKTQLAADCARAMSRSGAVDVLVWIGASTRPAIVSRYAQAAEEVLAADPGDPERAAETFLSWLEPKAGQERCRWLVVLDDVADPADLRGLWPPESPDGRVLVTTRSREAALVGPGRRLVNVGLFSSDEAVAYLGSALAVHGLHEPADQLRGLAAELGQLPLALAQAAAHLVNAGLGCADYRRLLADQVRKLAELLPEPGSLPDDHAATVAAAWSLSIERADRLGPVGLARPMLQLTSLLDPNGIPGGALTGGPALSFLTAHRTAGAGDQAPVTIDEATGALRILHRLSLIDHTPGVPHQAVRVHQLIQRATRDALPADRREHLARTGADALAAAWPEVERDTDLAQALRANTAALGAALTGHAEDALYRPDTHAVLYRAGRSLGESGQAATAREHFRHLAAETGRRLGPDHPDTLSSRHHLAWWRGHAGDAAGAATAAEELLADRRRVLGPDAPDTLTTRSVLAWWRGHSGDAAGAATATEELLADRRRVLGADHPDTLTARDSLAFWRGQAGDVAGAATAAEQLLTDRLRVQGPEHPATLITRHNLAWWRGQAGDAAGAATAAEQLLTDRLRILGPDHPATLTTRENLARWRGQAGDVAGAITAAEELLVDQRRVLGPDHPATLTTRHNLAFWRGQAGDVAGAATATEELLPDRLRIQGPDHPETLSTRDNLARWRGQAG
ncbi:tetratricopeptide repeat protein, partial [Kitasatospora sp. NPDC008050]|uniref:tetratricopeptide repeat protein n=1 Tax=Kitasatospora sp. NPDC008050 TaxID=3364021 RepID=UPI0036E7C9C5